MNEIKSYKCVIGGGETCAYQEVKEGRDKLEDWGWCIHTTIYKTDN